MATYSGDLYWYINPGTVGGVAAEPTYVLTDLADMRFEVLRVPVAQAVLAMLAPVTPHV
jgi:predicted phosphodiesterase